MSRARPKRFHVSFHYLVHRVTRCACCAVRGSRRKVYRAGCAGRHILCRHTPFPFRLSMSSCLHVCCVSYVRSLCHSCVSLQDLYCLIVYIGLGGEMGYPLYTTVFLSLFVMYLTYWPFSLCIYCDLPAQICNPQISERSRVRSSAAP